MKNYRLANHNQLPLGGKAWFSLAISPIASLAVLGLVLSVLPTLAQQYWDKNGTAPGAGGPFPNGSWSDAAWGSSDGTGTPTTYTSAGAVVFSAGTDATGTFFVNNGTVSCSIGNITVEEGSPTITNTGAFNLGATARATSRWLAIRASTWTIGGILATAPPVARSPAMATN